MHDSTRVIDMNSLIVLIDFSDAKYYISHTVSIYKNESDRINLHFTPSLFSTISYHTFLNKIERVVY